MQAGEKIILAGGKIILAGGKIILAGGEINLTLWGNYFDKLEIQKRIRGEISIHRFTNTKTQTGNNFIVPLNLRVDWSFPRLVIS